MVSGAGVYVIKCHSLIKIGCAKNVRRRLQDYRVHLPFPYRLVWVHRTDTFTEARACEREYHQRFASWRFRGEWFRWDTEVAAQFAALKQEQAS